MSMRVVGLLLVGAFVLVGFTDADRHYTRFCQNTPTVWDEPSESDFDSSRQHFSFLNRRATWARSVEQGARLSYLEWLLPRYNWKQVTFADRGYACYTHQSQR